MGTVLPFWWNDDQNKLKRPEEMLLCYSCSPLTIYPF